MNWRLKARLLVPLERLPGGSGAYSAVQDLKASRGHDADEMLGRSLDLLALHAEAGGRLPPGVCVEIGTGWCPWLPLLLRLGGAQQILTIDLNPSLSHATAIATTRDLIARVDRAAPALRREPSALRAELEPLLATRTLAEWLQASGIDYRAPVDARRFELPASSVDTVLGSNVLEHDFAASDRSITGANFLQYSGDEWRRLGGDSLAPHNRLRCVQHASFVRDAGLDVVVSRTPPVARARLAIESGEPPVHGDFTAFSAKELTDDYGWMAARAVKPAGVSPQAS